MGLVLGSGGVAEVIDVTIWSQVTDHDGTWRSINRQSLGADGHLAVIADPDPSLLTPDKRPPGTRRSRSQGGALAGGGLGASGLRGRAQFAMDFVLVGVRQQLRRSILPLAWGVGA
jgi:hypothetical protein